MENKSKIKIKQLTVDACMVDGGGEGEGGVNKLREAIGIAIFQWGVYLILCQYTFDSFVRYNNIGPIPVVAFGNKSA